MYAPGKIKYVGKYDGNAHAAADSPFPSLPPLRARFENFGALRDNSARDERAVGVACRCPSGETCKIFQSQIHRYNRSPHMAVGARRIFLSITTRLVNCNLRVVTDIICKIRVLGSYPQNCFKLS